MASKSKTNSKKPEVKHEQSDDEVAPVQTKQTKQSSSAKLTVQSTVNVPPMQTKQKASQPETKQVTKSNVKVKDVTHDSDDSDDDSENEKELVDNDDSDEEQVADDDEDEEEDEEDEDDASEDKPKQKKLKESYDDMTKRCEVISTAKKAVLKKLSANDKERKLLERERRKLEHEEDMIQREKDKRHLDEVKIALKTRPKRTGNKNGGFNQAKPIPDVLRKYLGIPEDTLLPRPAVMSAMNQKLLATKQKEGQTAILNESTLKALGLPHSEPLRVKFTEMQAFLAKFYKQDKVEVEV